MKTTKLNNKLLKEKLFEKHVEIKNKKCLVFLKC